MLSKGSEPVTVKLSAEVGHPISPYIFGSNHMKPDTIRDVGCTVNRWGGNRSSKYNWKRDVDNAGSDWFYMNGHHHGPNCGHNWNGRVWVSVRL
jgi:hypothetical protein